MRCSIRNIGLLAATSALPLAIAQTPDGFQPAVSDMLSVTFGSTVVSPAVTQSIPTLAASGNISGQYIFMMIDLDVPAQLGNASAGRVQLLHALVPGYSFTPNGTLTSSETTSAPAPYIRPAPPAENPPVPHRYVQLLFPQPENFSVPDSQQQAVQMRRGFNTTGFIAAAGLNTPILGNYFRVVNNSAVTSPGGMTPTPTGMPVSTDAADKIAGSALSAVVAIIWHFPKSEFKVGVIGWTGQPSKRVLVELSIAPACATPPAVTKVPAKSSSGVSLFDAEMIQVTDASIRRINAVDAPVNFTQLFGFENNISSAEKRPVAIGQCKVFPGDHNWPSPQEWQAFDFLLGGALVPTVPIAAPCYQDFGIYSKEKCDAVMENFGTTELHEADPTSMMWPIFQGRTCLPIDGQNGTSNCSLGGYPSYAVKVENVAQIQLSVNFARNANMRLVIKNTGHCYLGKSSGAGGLSVWTHGLRDIRFVRTFKNKEYQGPAMKISAGVLVRDVYIAAQKHGVTAIGGICPNVGLAGGYIQGGGHSSLSSKYGMAADQVLAFEVVTADGKFVTASSEQNPDLYWALRGGGGSTYGVVTSALIRVHPKTPVTTSRFTISTSSTVSRGTFWAAVKSFYENFTRFTDAGSYVYFFITNTGGTLSLQIIPFFAPDYTPTQFTALVDPWFAQLRRLNVPFTPNTTYYEDFYSAYDANFGDDNPIGSTTVMPGNRLFPRSNFVDKIKFAATFDAVRKNVEAGYLTIGFAMAPGNPLRQDNAVSSAFRQAVSLHITNVVLPEHATPAQIKTGSEELNMVTGRWRAAAPESAGGGSYLNEAHIMEPEWQSSFYGEQYGRLKELKRKWDPWAVFYATTAVGSEDWEVRDGDQGVWTQNGKLCRVR
ncbi:hypothetical protein EJ05DRAFT_490472 [Pseudovirgaria hyperparasitica]|uniref:FAD-binding PCMH-type domain-containing protein n=1 Tax=Pseudovirgaria hyperparasitica TaxID=470096 RepID=A0A6A6VUX3_9PEZI|nr:uncharacterized protein EJ05DRAFT_490472 [Pseudovirgaria hyperparasitica]KAF2753067.1 hypothetical protein EJ05DRAFT_490472 [Pseudovirgaria hyperparasitica]